MIITSLLGYYYYNLSFESLTFGQAIIPIF